MDKGHGETFISGRDWLGRRLWSIGYDDGWDVTRLSPNPTDFFDRGEYVAGFVRGQRDRLEEERE